MLTLKFISEQVRSMIEGGDPPQAAKFELGEVKAAVIQTINGLIKAQHFTQTMGGGEYIPDGLVLAEYDNVPVETYKNVSRATLPVMPVSLPVNMGIFHVSRTDNIIDGFIPFQSGQLQMIGEENLISDVLGQISYEPRGKYLIFNKDITTNGIDDVINEVYCLLVVKDLSLYTDWEMLPISADMEGTVIEQTFTRLTGKLPNNKKVDVINKEATA